MAKTQDLYSNVLIDTVVETGANTLTFSQLPQLTTLMEKKAYLVNRITYEYNSLACLDDDDAIDFGLSMSNQWTTPAFDETSIIDWNHYETYQMGAATVLVQEHLPLTKDYSTLPGFGLLLPTRPMYLYVMGTSLAGAQTIKMRMYFTVQDLDPAQYWDLVESISMYT